MLTKFGKTLRKYRIDREMKLLTLAEALGVAPSYLSAVENGKKNVSDNLVNKISQCMELSEYEKAELKQSAIDSKNIFKLNLSEKNNDTRDTFVRFARSIESDALTETQLEKIRSILEEA